MLSINSVYMLLGGLGLFFFGMQLMSDGMKKVSGERLRNFLHKATKLPIMGVGVGALVTSLVQSSSATSIMVVGFVNAGLLTLRQAITVIMGANIGTTFTAWLVSVMGAFDIAGFSLLAVAAGVLIMKTAKSRKARFTGEVILGFGILFTGLALMKDAAEPLKDSAFAESIFISFSRSPVLGVLAGLIFTVLLQSSSATIAMVQVLAFNGLISFEAAVPIILGENIGTTIKAQVAALGANLAARRAAMSHSLFNIIGVCYMLVFVYLGWFTRFVEFVLPGEVSPATIMFYIAFSHSLFNIFNTAVFLPFTGTLERLSVWLVKKKEYDMERGTRYLEPHLLESPALALDQVHSEISYMLSLSVKSVRTAMEGLKGDGYKKAKKISKLETAINTLQSEITQYMVDISARELTEDENSQIPVLIHSVNDIERIGDHAENIIDLAERKNFGRITFSGQAQKELEVMWEKISIMLERTSRVFKEEDTSSAEEILELEEEVNSLQKKFKENHIHRLNEKTCDIKTGIIFVELIDNLEKVGDHLANIAEGIKGNMHWRRRRAEAAVSSPGSAG